MVQTRSGTFDLEQTCRCCLRNSSKLLYLEEAEDGDTIGDSKLHTNSKTTTGYILMEVANVQVLFR